MTVLDRPASPVPPVDDRAGGPPPSRRTRPAHPFARFVQRSTWPAWANLVCLAGVVGITLSQLHPNLLVAATTTAGGDTGAHVTMPYFLEHHLLPTGRITGWDPSWYDGFPLYTFYFPMPGLVTVLFNAVVNYDVAFKLVTVLGSVTLPVAAWLFGRLAGLRDPIPAALAASTLAFLFEPSFSIYGGNLLSTLAGEYSFSLSLSAGLVFLGLVASGLRTGRWRALAPLVLAFTLLCHLLPTIFILVGAALLLLLDADLAGWVTRGRAGRRARRRWLRRSIWLAVTAGLGLGLTAWWLVPFAAYQSYTTNMGYTKVYGFWHILFPASSRWVWILAIVGLVVMVSRWNRIALFLALMAAGSAGMVIFDPAGKLYNVRFLPFWFLCLYLLGGYAVGEIIAGLARFWGRRRRNQYAWVIRNRLPSVLTFNWEPGQPMVRLVRPAPSATPPGAVAGPLVALLLAAVAVVPALVVPWTSTLESIGITPGADQPSSWSAWNYSGYQQKPDFPEYNAVIQMMEHVGASDGCGRAMWEYDPSLNRFGTTMALMDLPYWTNQCIDSMEGLLFESSSTTPYHFINQNELSANPSDAISDPAITYGGLNVPLGLEHLQLLGVRYFLASSPSVQAAAAADPAATLVDSTGPWTTDYNGEQLKTTWKVYRIAATQLVVPLSHQPVVWDNVQPAQSSWLAPAVSWYDDPARWSVTPSAGGPANWQRIPASDTHPVPVAEPRVKVENIVQGDESISFHVDRTGVPVEVRTSYFPNWKVTGATGPWRLAPNLMVVVPTSHNVTLNYGRTGVDLAGQVVTLASGAVVAALAAMTWTRRRRRRKATAPVGS